MNIKKVPLLSMLLIAAAVPLPASACSCAGGPAEKQLAESDFAFEGYVSSGPDFGRGGSAVFTFGQLEILKGSPRSSVDIYVGSVSGSSCGYNFLPDVKYRVYASIKGRRLWAGLCSSSVVKISNDE